MVMCLLMVILNNIKQWIMQMENNNRVASSKNLLMIIFNGRHYVGEQSQDKSVALANAAEFVLETAVDGKRIYVGCFHGDILAGHLTDRLIIRLHSKSMLYLGYFKVLTETFGQPVSKTSELEIPI